MAKARSRVLVFVDEGTGPMSSSALSAALALVWPEREIGEVDASGIRSGALAGDVAVLAFPGGADLPWLAALGVEGAAAIRRFVRDGGVYFGVCAGAYFASARCEFLADDGTEIAGPRPLGFFPGVARGPLREFAPSFDGDDEGTARMVRLTLYPGGGEAETLYWGGPEFVTGHGELAGSGGWRVLARYSDGRLAAVDCGIGAGKAILSAVHPELWIEGGSVVCAATARLGVLRHVLGADG